MFSNETADSSSPPILLISLTISIVVFLIIGIWKTRSGFLHTPGTSVVLYPVDCMVDLMTELAEHKELLGKEMEKKIQDSEMRRIKALEESVKKGQEVRKKNNDMRKLEEERNQAREDARQRRCDIEWLFSKRNRTHISLAPELRWPSFPEISAASSSSTRGADPKLPAAGGSSTTDCRLPAAGGASSLFQKTNYGSTAVAQGDPPEIPTTPTLLPPLPSPNRVETTDLVSPSESPLSSTNTSTNSPTPAAASSMTNHHYDHLKCPSKKELKGSFPTNALKEIISIPSHPVPPRGSRNDTSSAPAAISTMDSVTTRLNSKQELPTIPDKKL